MQAPPNAAAYEFIPEAERKAAEQLSRPSLSYWQDAWRRLKRDRLAMVGLTFVVLMGLLAIFGPMFSPYAYDYSDFSAISQGPSAKHWFGTDALGRDLFVRILYGARISLAIGLVSALVNMVIGVIYGGTAGFIGGRTDNIMMRIVDILIALPSLLYIVILMMFMGSNIRSILIALCISSWVGTARITRSQVVSLKQQEYVLSARLAGASSWEILIRHLLPNSMGPVIVSVTFLIPSAIFSEAFLSFLGIGIQKPMASWGSLANDAIETLRSAPYQMFFPVAAISLTMFSLNFIGDGLRDALDPRLRK
jgi:oligopeptide transport system permease protein